MALILAQAVNYFLLFLQIAIFVRIIFSWIPIGNNPISALAYSVTEPVLAPIRSILAKSPLGGPGMMLDFSPLLFLLIIRVAQPIVINFLLTIPF